MEFREIFLQMFEQSLAKKPEFIKKECLNSLICKNHRLLNNKNECYHSLRLKSVFLLNNNNKCLYSLLLENKVLLKIFFKNIENSGIRLCGHKSFKNYFILFRAVKEGERHHLTPPKCFTLTSLRRGGLNNFSYNGK